MTSLRTEGRNGQIWTAYVAGRTVTHIAEQYGISHQRVSQIIREVAESIPEADREAIKVRHLEVLDVLHAEMTDLALTEAPPAFQFGKPLIDPDTARPLRDYAARFAAVDRLLKVQERIARLVDLDAPARSAVQVELPEQVAALLERSREARGGAP